jgi:hypothetical protein
VVGIIGALLGTVIAAAFDYPRLDWIEMIIRLRSRQLAS